MRLNDALNLVLPMGKTQVYHTPISLEVFELHYKILAGTRAALSSKSVAYQMVAGPRIARLALLDEAKQSEEEESARSFLAEIKRLTMILCPTPQGYSAMPVDAAIQAGHIDAEDWAEAESALVFFTCMWSMESRANRAQISQATASLLAGSITSSNASEYVASLAGSMTKDSSKAAGSAAASLPM